MNYLFALSRRRFLLVAFILGLLGSPSPGSSEEKDPSSQAAEPSPVNPATLDPVIVIGQTEREPEPSSSELAGETIEALPLRNNQVTEAVKLLPHVQVSDDAELSTQAGEILPSAISISGGRFYRNNFQVDGFETNDFINPGGNYFPAVPDMVPTSSFTSFPNISFLQSITVLDSNISAEYGGFTGGVVESETRNPTPEFGGRVYARTTRNSWTSFHVSSEDEKNFQYSEDEKFQPRFRKEEGGIELNIPVNEHFGLLVGYSIIHSDIPLHLLGKEKDQTRQLENFLVKGLYQWTPVTSVNLSLLTTPARSSLFLKNTRNSQYELEQGGIHISGGINHFFHLGLLDVKATYGKSWSERQAPSIYRSWDITPSADWGEPYDDKSLEGGFGNLEQQQENYQLKAKAEFDPFRMMGTENVFRIGADLQQVDGRFVRDEDSVAYAGAYGADNGENPPEACNDVNCIAGEQFLGKRIIYEKFHTEARLRIARLWLEDRINLNRLSIRPGLHVSYDDLMENLDLSPRLSAYVDVFGTGDTVLNAGFNRYHAAPLLTYALRERFPPKITEKRELQEDGSLSPWTSKIATFLTRFDELETPYSDELTAGLEQSFAGGRLTLTYIQRKGRDELAKEMVDGEVSGTRNWILNNTGKSRYKGYSMSWDRQSGPWILGANVTYIAENTISNSDYEGFFDEEKATERVWFKGEAVFESDLPRQEYNREWSGNLFLSTRLPWGFSFTNVTRYRSGFSKIEETDKDPIPVGEDELDIYEEVDHPESWIFDWKLAWTSPAVHGNRLTLTAEVLNVFNKEILAGAADDEYEIGRQLWAGAEWRF